MIANCITISRILISLFLLVFSLPLPSFSVLYLLCGITDILDGFFARLFHTESKIGELLDSIADLIFAIFYVIKIFPVLHITSWILIWIFLIGVAKIYLILQKSKKKQRFYIEHSFSNKLTGLLIFLLPLTIRFIDTKYSVIIVCIAATFTTIDNAFDFKKEELSKFKL